MTHGATLLVPGFLKIHELSAKKKIPVQVKKLLDLIGDQHHPLLKKSHNGM
jgi:hypothetical protein